MRNVIFALPVLLIITACTSVSLKPADFAWPIESVITTDSDGFANIDRYSTGFNAGNLFTTEFGDTAVASNKQVRIIRGQDGYYYLTAAGFKNVYLFYAKDGKLILSEKILVTEDGLSQPVFNQRQPYIQLLDGENSYLLNSDGLKEE